MTSYEEFPLDFWQESTAEQVLFDLINETHQPLQTIKGFSQALLNANLSEEQRVGMLEAILAQASYLESMLKAVREYTDSLPGSQKN
jgi:hypothetical protein